MIKGREGKGVQDRYTFKWKKTILALKQLMNEYLDEKSLCLLPCPPKRGPETSILWKYLRPKYFEMRLKGRPLYWKGSLPKGNSGMSPIESFRYCGM